MQRSTEPRILIVSPVRNEAPHIVKVARAVAAQELRPARWVVIDDGSSDGTLERLRELERELPIMTVLEAPPRAPEGSGAERMGAEGTGRKGTGAEGTGAEGTGRKETGAEGTGAEGTGPEGAGRKGTGAERAGAEGTGPDDASEDPRDRLAHAIEVRNFNLALAQTDDGTYTHVMKLDGDIELPPHYLRVLLERFAHDPSLGLAGGVLVEPTDGGGVRRIKIPAYHVHGALKCYSRACLSAIGGVQERLGWDTIDETYARMRGFRTQSFSDLVSVHHRPLASADGALRGHARHGECAYVAHYDPLWVALRSFKVARRRPRALSGAAFLYGYARAAARHVERVPDRDFRRFTRRELRTRMFGGSLKLGDSSR